MQKSKKYSWLLVLTFILFFISFVLFSIGFLLAREPLKFTMLVGSILSFIYCLLFFLYWTYRTRQKRM